MTSKCGKNKKVAHEAIAECVTDVLTTFWRLLWSITEQTWNLLVLYNKKVNFIRIKADGDVNRASALSKIIGKNQSKCENNLSYYIITINVAFDIV